MTDHKVTPEQWAQIASWKEIGSLPDACLLDLLERVESLEANICQWRIDHLRLANACASGDIVSIISFRSYNSTSGNYASFSRNEIDVNNVSAIDCTGLFTLNSGYELI